MLRVRLELPAMFLKEDRCLNVAFVCSVLCGGDVGWPLKNGCQCLYRSARFSVSFMTSNREYPGDLILEMFLANLFFIFIAF